MPEGNLDHAAEPRGVQRNLMQAGVIGTGGERKVDVLVPQTAQTHHVLAERSQAPALSWAMTASATWLVPTAEASSRLSLRSYVTLRPSAITPAMAPSSA